MALNFGGINVNETVEYFFFDMDGVLAQFHLEENYQSRMKDPGFLRNLRPYTKMIGILRAVINEVGMESVFIMSAAFDAVAEAEKIEWLGEHVPEIPRRQMVFCPVGSDKSIYAPDINKSLLFDDFTKNLFDWQRAGGRAIKVLNGINGIEGKWKGAKIVGF